MEALKLTVTCEALRPVRLGHQAGSKCRGMIGQSLRSLVCTYPGRDCATCPARSCLFRELFAQSTQSKPYAIDASSAPARLEAGQTFDCHLYLMGPATKRWHYFAEAALAAGIHDDTALKLVRVADGDRVLEPGADAPAPVQIEPLSGTRWRVRLITPMRLIEQGALVKPSGITAEVLGRAIASRMAKFGLQSPNPDTIRLEAANVRWQELQRYSGRLGRTHPASGLIGTLTLASDDRGWASALAWAKVAGVGKGATFGLGRIAATSI